MKWIVVRMAKGQEWETRDALCIVDTEEQAIRIYDWCEKNCKYPLPNECKYTFYIAPVKQVNSLDEFCKHFEEEFEW